jgi:N-acetylmuramoyl-L-alanine amidase
MKTAFLSAGHSGTDPGAVTTQDLPDGKKAQRKESDIGVEFRNMVSFYLSRAGVPHELDGTGTTNLPLREAVVKARRHPIGLEFHCNASANPTATGVECLSAPDDAGLSADLCKALAGALGIRNRGAKPENAGQHHRLAFVQAGGVIVELFFITNPADLAAYDEKKWLAAKAVADVLIKDATQ